MNDFQFTANQLERYLQKQASDFTINDIVSLVYEKEVEMINFRYVDLVGKLKSLNFVVTGKEELRSLLTNGERVNGKAIFSYLKNVDQDIYLIPKCNTAFLNPFSDVPTLDILCSFYRWDGKILDSSPEVILKKTNHLFEDMTGCTLKMFGELEYYVISNNNESFYDLGPAYQNPEPYAKHEKLRIEAMRLIAQCGGKIRFGHTENGAFLNGSNYFEQHEIEFLPTQPIDAIEQLYIARWIIRMLAKKYSVEISFVPKIMFGKPGNGLHIHFILERDGKNIVSENGKITEAALKMISGILDLSPSLTSFGNTIPLSYIRLTESKIGLQYICWGISNRSALIRIPKININAIQDDNKENVGFNYNQTIEYRGADATAYLYFFISGLMLAAMYGYLTDDNKEDVKTYEVSEDLTTITDQEVLNSLRKLPGSCYSSALYLEKHQAFYTHRYNIFPSEIIQYIIDNLKSYDDRNLQNELLATEKSNQSIWGLVQQYMHLY